MQASPATAARTALTASLLAGGLLWLSAGAQPTLVELANPLQGTGHPNDFSRGNCYPAIALPFPMNAWAPYTAPAAEGLFYHYRHKSYPPRTRSSASPATITTAAASRWPMACRIIS